MFSVESNHLVKILLSIFSNHSDISSSHSDWVDQLVNKSAFVDKIVTGCVMQHKEGKELSTSVTDLA